MTVAPFANINLSLMPGPDNVSRRVFPNGIVGLAYENPSSPSVVVHGWIWAGSIDAPAEKAGLASFTASMLTRGTARYTFSQLSEQVESLGASLNFGSSGHTTRFTIKCLVEDLATLLGFLTDCLYNPTFPSEYIERRRGQILTSIEQRNHSTQAMASLAFSNLMYPNHPYRISQLGYEESIIGISREDIVAFYRDHYGPQRMGVAIVGAAPRDKGLDILEEAFGKWVGTCYTPPALPQVNAVEGIKKEHVAIPGKSQSDVVVGWLGLKRTDPDFVIASLSNCILGEFGLMGRVGNQVRQENGLAYYAYTLLEAGLGPGPWAALAGTDPDNVERAVEGILTEVQRLQTEPVDQEELEDNKSYIIGSIPLRLEGNEGIAAQIVEMELFKLGLDYTRRFPGLIDAVTAEDIIQVARTYLNPEAYVLAVAGPDSGDC